MYVCTISAQHPNKIKMAAMHMYVKTVKNIISLLHETEVLKHMALYLKKTVKCKYILTINYVYYYIYIYFALANSYTAT
jgi:hypothetical protein